LKCESVALVTLSAKNENMLRIEQHQHQRHTRYSQELQHFVALFLRAHKGDEETKQKKLLEMFSPLLTLYFFFQRYKRTTTTELKE
jgi:prephenate dehydrogenase